MAATGVNARWQAEMAEFSEDLEDARPDTGFVRLAEVFHLEGGETERWLSGRLSPPQPSSPLGRARRVVSSAGLS